MASFVGSMFGTSAGASAGTGNSATHANRGQNTSAPPRVQQHPWPFNRTLDSPSRRYRPTRHETPDPLRHRHGSGARTDPQPSSNRSATPATATPRDRSRERQASEAPGLSALAAHLRSNYEPELPFESCVTYRHESKATVRIYATGSVRVTAAPDERVAMAAYLHVRKIAFTLRNDAMPEMPQYEHMRSEPNV